MLRRLRLITVMENRTLLKRWNTLKLLKSQEAHVFCLSLLVLTSVFSTTGNDKTYAEDHSYDGKSPYYNSCDQSAVTKEKEMD